MLRKLLHIVTAVMFGFASYYHYYHVDSPRRREHSFGGSFKYLTFIDILLQTVFFIICFLNDVFGSNDVKPKKTPQIRKIKDFYHACLGFPLAAFVSISFWALYAIDRELVFPKVLDEYFPTWLNHLVHTNILVFSLAELIVSFRVYPSRSTGLKVLTSFMFVYLGWTFFIYGKTGRWVYPVMEVLNWPLRICFIAVLLAFSTLTYIMGEQLNKLIWSKELKMIESSKQSSKKR